jgi:hypothetical protein
LLEIIGVVAKVGPRLSTSIVGQLPVNFSNTLRRIDIGDIGTKVKKVRPAVGWVPIEFLPCI